MRVAAIDIGSNTIRLLVADLTDKGFSTVRHERRVTRLASGMQESGLISGLPLRDTLDVVNAFASMAREDGAELIRAAATSALREAANGPEALREIEAASGVEVLLVSGDEEARIMSRGVLHSFPHDGEYLIFDLGGGSTEFVLAKRGNLTRTLSIPMGVVKLLEANVHNDPPSAEDIRRLDDQAGEVAVAANNTLGAMIAGNSVLIATAGTATTLASLDLGLEQYDADRVQGHVLGVDTVRSLESAMQALPIRRRRELKGMEPERADLIIAGVRVTLRVMESLGFRELTVSDHGLLEGLVIDMMQEY